MTDLPVEFSRDTAAACVAELVAGQGRSIRSYLYLYLGTFIGGGLVIDSHLHSGTRGNAGAVGSLPLGVSGKGMPKQLLEVASLWNLEQMFEKQGLDKAAIYDTRALQKPWLSQTGKWMAATAESIAFTATTAASIMDIEGVIVDGICDRALLEALLAKIDQELRTYN